ncbi:MAG: xylulokinase [Rhodobacteraceae bacterium]|nr:MAG: xylulokinase [Paracoccaceae bacterium]
MEFANFLEEISPRPEGFPGIRPLYFARPKTLPCAKGKTGHLMFLGIDLGTSAVKVSLVGDDLQPLATTSVALTLSTPHPGQSEQDPEDWRRATIRAVRALGAEADLSGVAGIGLSGQMHGAVLLGADDAVLRPAILWNDGRAAEICARLEAEHPELAAIAGVRPMPGFTAPKLAWLAEHEPETWGKVARVCLPKDHIGLWLHGNHVTDGCDAAGTWWFDQSARRWSPALCAATATDPAWLPEPRDGTDLAGPLRAEAAETLGLPPGVPVAVGGGDIAAGAVSVGAVRAGRGFISLGTSGQLFTATDGFRAAPEAGLHSFAHCLPGQWFQMAAMLNGARPMSWFAEVAGQEVGALLEEAATASGDIPLFLPYLTGERTPHGDSRIRGAFYGLADATGRGEMMRAVVEAIAYAFCDGAEAMRLTTAIPQPLLAIGGGTRSDLLLQTIADATGLELARGAGAEAGPGLGAARMAAVAIGAARLDDLDRQPEVDRAFTPRAAQAARHADRLARYRALYQALKPLRQET